MKAKLIVIISVLILIVIIFGASIIKTNAYENTAIPEFSVLIKDGDEDIANFEDMDIVYEYNTLLFPMDIIFEYIFDDYNMDTDQQTLSYNSTTLEIDRINEIVTVPDIYEYDSEEIDNSVDVEIELIDGTLYIPIYLLTNISGISISADGKTMYSDEDYYNSEELINESGEQCEIIIVLGDEEEEEELSDTEYYGEEDGALWREEAYKRIEKYRKNDVNIIVKNQNGRVLENAYISVEMESNDFKFGTAVRMVEKTGINKYTNITSSLFNTIGSESGFKWQKLNQNGTSIQNDVIEYAQNNEMYARGHYLWSGNTNTNSDTYALVGSEEDLEEGTMAYVYTKYQNGEITENEANELINEIIEELEELVLNHIDYMLTEFSYISEWDVINEPLNQQYFPWFLYNRKLLTDSTFLTKYSYNDYSCYKDYGSNEYYEQYLQFLAECFDKARETNSSLKLVINDNTLTGDNSNYKTGNTIDLINRILNYTTNIDALGIQYHVNNIYRYTPQSYYNNINYVLEETGLSDAVITEYDNYISSKLNNYTDEEKEEKANYLKDTLISAYSNTSISEFSFWVYNSGTGSFVEEEWEAYEELAQEWLNDEQSGTTDDEGTYTTRAYSGTYSATATINSLVSETVTFSTSEDTNTVELLITSNLTGLSIGQKPNKLEYIQNYETLDLEGGIILASYDDGTTEEISMTSEDVTVTGIDNSVLGLQTVTVTYEEEQITFVVEVVEKQVESLEILQLPDIITYSVGDENIDLTGGIILVTYNDESTQEIAMTLSEIEVSGFNTTEVGVIEVTLSYLENEISFSVTVTESSDEDNNTETNTTNDDVDESSEEITDTEEDTNSEESAENETVESNTTDETDENDESDEITIEELSIKQMPDKIEYIQNYDKLDLTGGIITITYTNGDTEDIAMTSSKLSVSDFDNTELGAQTITISYENAKVELTIYIVEKSLESIQVETLPTKTSYAKNQEDLDLTGGSILLVYDDESTESISMLDDDVAVSGFDNSIIGERAITISYQEKSTTFAVTIIASGETSTSESAQVLPNTGIISIILISTFLIGIVTPTGYKYIKYLKDTHKQL